MHDPLNFDLDLGFFVAIVHAFAWGAVVLGLLGGAETRKFVDARFVMLLATSSVAVLAWIAIVGEGLAQV